MSRLVLTRRIGEVITIHDNIRITINEINGSQVRVLVDAPREVPVHRSEIWDRIQAQKNVSG